MLLGSELLYHETDLPALLATAEHHMAAGGVFVTVYHARVWGITSNLQAAARDCGAPLPCLIVPLCFSGSGSGSGSVPVLSDLS